MKTGKVIVYYGNGRGKTSSALGYALAEAGKGDTAIIISFLKQKDGDVDEFMKRLEPEIRQFRFQKSEKIYDDLTEEERFDENRNMMNGLNYARKTLANEDCSVLVLDEILGLLDRGIISMDEMKALLDRRQEETDLILTGRVLHEDLIPYIDEAFEISVRKA
ncbi:MAG: cob(I)yrinic acid a c-diamide adenosyltransferase [Lachnospiraceae bacterium]|nr:cob(I)yrinic acid a c-diamide adenosyltransferase [Lachnospiraceae bacterium]